MEPVPTKHREEFRLPTVTRVIHYGSQYGLRTAALTTSWEFRIILTFLQDSSFEKIVKEVSKQWKLYCYILFQVLLCMMLITCILLTLLDTADYYFKLFLDFIVF